MFLEEINSIKIHRRYPENKWGFKLKNFWDSDKKKKRYSSYVNPLKIIGSWFHPIIGSPCDKLVSIYWTTETFCNCPDSKYRKRECKHIKTFKKNKLIEYILNKKLLEIFPLINIIKSFILEE